MQTYAQGKAAHAQHLFVQLLALLILALHVDQQHAPQPLPLTCRFRIIARFILTPAMWLLKELKKLRRSTGSRTGAGVPPGPLRQGLLQ